MRDETLASFGFPNRPRRLPSLCPLGAEVLSCRAAEAGLQTVWINISGGPVLLLRPLRLHRRGCQRSLCPYFVAGLCGHRPAECIESCFMLKATAKLASDDEDGAA